MPADLHACHAAFAIPGVVYTGVPVAQDVDFPDNVAAARLNAVTAGLAQPGVYTDVTVLPYTIMKISGFY